jgi:hypothetical protein
MAMEIYLSGPVRNGRGSNQRWTRSFLSCYPLLGTSDVPGERDAGNQHVMAGPARPAAIALYGGIRSARGRICSAQRRIRSAHGRICSAPRSPPLSAVDPHATTPRSRAISPVDHRAPALTPRWTEAPRHSLPGGPSRPGTHSPVNRGGRFSRKAARPSAWSAVAPASPCSFASPSSASSRSIAQA